MANLVQEVGIEGQDAGEVVASVNEAADIEAFVHAVNEAGQDGFVGASEPEVVVGHGVVDVVVVVFEIAAGPQLEFVAVG